MLTVYMLLFYLILLPHRIFDRFTYYTLYSCRCLAFDPLCNCVCLALLDDFDCNMFKVILRALWSFCQIPKCV
jgi:hypothetical protein